MNDRTDYQPPFHPPTQTPPQHFAPPKKRHTVRNVLLILTGLFIVGMVGCFVLVGKVATDIDEDANTEHTVVYKVTGVKGDLTYTTDGAMTTEQQQGTELPWSKTLKVKGLIPVYQVRVQNSLGHSGQVTCSITVDGKIVKSATASGEGAIASCVYSK